MKIVISGDWHLGAIVGGWDMHNDIMRVAKEVVLATHNADLFVLPGDLFHHPRPIPRAYAAAIELLDGVGCPFVVMSGNHDAGTGFFKGEEGELIPFPDALEPLRKINFRAESRFLELPSHIPLDRCLDLSRTEDGVFSFIGHVSDALARHVSDGKLGAQEYIDKSFEEARAVKARAVFSHLNVDGARGGSEESFLIGGDLRMPLLIAKELPCPVFNSHIHRRQELPPNIHMPGSIIPTDFGDRDGNKGYLTVEL